MKIWKFPYWYWCFSIFPLGVFRLGPRSWKLLGGGDPEWRGTIVIIIIIVIVFIFIIVIIITIVIVNIFTIVIIIINVIVITAITINNFGWRCARWKLLKTKPTPRKCRWSSSSSTQSSSPSHHRHHHHHHHHHRQLVRMGYRFLVRGCKFL